MDEQEAQPQTQEQPAGFQGAPLSATRALMDGFEPDQTPAPTPPTTPEHDPGDEQPGRRRGPDGKFLPNKPQHDSHVLAMAKQFGFSDQEIAEATPEALGLAVRREAKRLAEPRPGWSSAEGAPQPAPASPEPKTWALDWGQNPDNKTPYSQDDFGPAGSVLRQLQDRNNYLEAELASVNARLSALENGVRGDRVATAKEQFERFFSRHPEFYGSGGMEELDKKSAEFARRKMLIERGRDHHTGGPILRAASRAESELYPHLNGQQQQQAPARRPDPPRQDVELGPEWNGTHGPSGRGQPELPPGRERAIHRFSQLRQQHPELETQDYTGHFLPAN